MRRTSEKPLECSPLEAENDVARRDSGAGQHRVALDGADGEAGEVVIPGRVHARHLRRLAADQGAADGAAGLGDAGDDRPSGLDLELTGGEVVEEEQRLGALHDEVVDAHGNEVDADRLVPPGGDGDLQLGADTVGGRDQDGIAKPRRLEIEERAEAAEPGIGAAPRRRPGERLDRLDQRVAGIDVDASGAIARLRVAAPVADSGVFRHSVRRPARRLPPPRM